MMRARRDAFSSLALDVVFTKAPSRAMSDKATLHAEPAAIGADDAAAARTIPGADEQANGHANGQANGHVGARPGASARKRTAFTEPDVDDGGAPRNPTRSETMNSRGSRRSGHRQESNGSMLSRISSMLKPEHKLGKDPTLKASAMAIVKASWLNVLLVFIPVGWALHFAIPTSYLAGTWPRQLLAWRSLRDAVCVEPGTCC